MARFIVLLGAGLGPRLRVVVAIAVAALTWAACGSSLPTPELRAHPATAARPIEVPYPPPAARVEVIPPKPRAGAVWVDGEYSWQGRQWTWESGGWLMPPPQAFFAPWTTYRAPTGKLYFSPGAWYRDNGQPLPKPPVLAPAQTSLENEGAPEDDAGAREDGGT